MELSNEIVLRPRFSKDLSISSETALQAFEKQREAQKEFVITRVDDHVFIRIPKKDQHFLFHIFPNVIVETKSVGPFWAQSNCLDVFYVFTLYSYITFYHCTYLDVYQYRAKGFIDLSYYYYGWVICFVVCSLFCRTYWTRSR